MKVIEKDDTSFAIILRKEDQDLDKPLFITKSDSPLQIGILSHPAGYAEKPHYHKIRERRIKGVPQMLFLKKGRFSVDFFDRNGIKFDSVEVFEGDLIVLLDGTHKLVVKENMNAVIAKLGPYAGVEEDKVEIIERQ
ncbi:MAG: hypothetical protein M0Z77_04740 [Thermoplasmatales archaeon]|nr:hypothetical protein [Thermoplasmatales archaeon]